MEPAASGSSRCLGVLLASMVKLRRLEHPGCLDDLGFSIDFDLGSRMVSARFRCASDVLVAVGCTSDASKPPRNPTETRQPRPSLSYNRHKDTLVVLFDFGTPRYTSVLGV